MHLSIPSFISQEVEIMHEKEIEKLQAEKEKVERQLAQEEHKIQRLENRSRQDLCAKLFAGSG